MLLILDASKSMNEPAGDGGTRLDAAKEALRELIPSLPQDANVGLRVYGSQVSGASRKVACRDTELVVPVEPLDPPTLTERIDGLQGRGRTPIGRSLEAAPDDLPDSGRRVVVLISDGGDNCAPPDPCKAAARVAKQGVNLSISVVGLQVTERVKRQLKCIADAGGGSYVDARDGEALRKQLLAALARVFRSYEPAGTPVTGAPEPAAAPTLGEGQYLDEIRPGESKSWAIRVGPGQRLYGALTLALPRGLDGIAGLQVKLIDPTGEEVIDDSAGVRYSPLGQFGNIDTRAVRGAQTAAPGIDSEAPPGVWRISATLDTGSLEPEPIPLELVLQTLDPNEAPGLARRPGPPPGPPSPPGGGEPAPRPSPEATPAPEDDGGGGGGGLIAAGVGLAAGAAGGFGMLRRRRS